MTDFYKKDGKLFPITPVTVEPMKSDETIFEHTVSSLQTGLFIGNGKIVGTLNYISSGALPAVWGAGNFMALQFGGDAFRTAKHIYVGLDPTAGSGLVDIIEDPDRNGAFKVTNKIQQVVVVIDWGNGYTETMRYDLDGLTLNAE